ncbi:hypothetical protein PHYSODRAFT_347360 [Phytophthora sojae]|uniref:Ubiquitin-like domain-containing protein n=1 Tax=Phytophthora sojae (strain P6497) TaxID=1094619 RepID=G4ZVU0_PHYSP|nr:hypothetical protein PHYSODRAFT_347360 [Phytophthora sojae]EGZ12276.1 hypothetical protein PHYSODRAFT_347360 [Phytophthora sojae]|eukprot:XP_009532609.1 hypothetical protein PHYSODRAFT_347360 [Phytophthora sojae]
MRVAMSTCTPLHALAAAARLWLQEAAAQTPQYGSSMGPYIRVKRRNQTVFLDVQTADSFLSVKEKLGALFHLPPTSIQLWQGLNQKESKEFADAATLADHELQNDAVIYMCWKKENSDQWEELSVTKVEALDSGDASGSSSSGVAGNSAKTDA